MPVLSPLVRGRWKFHEIPRPSLHIKRNASLNCKRDIKIYQQFPLVQGDSHGKTSLAFPKLKMLTLLWCHSHLQTHVCSWATRAFASFPPFPFPFRVFAAPGTLQAKLKGGGSRSYHGLQQHALLKKTLVETFTNSEGRFTSQAEGLHRTAAMQIHGHHRRPTKLLPSLEVIQVAASSICRCPTPNTLFGSLDST